MILTLLKVSVAGRFNSGKRAESRAILVLVIEMLASRSSGPLSFVKRGYDLELLSNVILPRVLPTMKSEMVFRFAFRRLVIIGKFDAIGSGHPFTLTLLPCGVSAQRSLLFDTSSPSLSPLFGIDRTVIVTLRGGLVVLPRVSLHDTKILFAPVERLVIVPVWMFPRWVKRLLMELVVFPHLHVAGSLVERVRGTEVTPGLTSIVDSLIVMVGGVVSI